MQTLLLRTRSCLGATLVLIFLTVVPVLGQQPKLKNDHTPQKGHALYKQAKIYDSEIGPVGVKPKAFGDRALDRWLFEQRQLKNPFTGEIPQDIQELEIKFTENIQARSLQQELSKSAGENYAKRSRFSYWRNRGPGNIGGRTRALALDRRDENTILAGGVSGGLWRSTNAGQTWRKVTLPFQSPSITAIVQDPRPGRSRIWYYASGEFLGNSASAGGAFYTGSGIFKSFNNGRTWFQLRNTRDEDLTSFAPFDVINSLAIDPDNGDLYAATLEGVYRSQNGGRDFELVLPGAFASFTEVKATSDGKIYATVDFFSDADSGFFVTEDGDSWTEITPPDIFPTIGRTVMGVDPSDENRIFFFSENLSAFSEAFLWRYQADAATPEEQWVDLSVNLPTTIGGPVGDLNLQGGYNMVVKVHPENPDLVFIGGTNLYRSVDGFTSLVGPEGWIGGYDIANNISIYPNQHPDQHNLVFLPSDPNKAIAATDGGVHRTEDISMPGPVEWTSLNNNYITTQPYAISFDPEANSDDLLAGFQDNGTWFTNSVSLNDPWIEDFSGDGTFNAIADGGLTRYVSAQFGVIFRFNFDENGEFLSFTRVQPSGASGFAFVAPFVLDPINDNVMYLPAGDRIWRNNNLDEIPLFSNATTSVNWSEQTQTATLDQSQVTALDVSKFPIANRLYYGTATGGIYKVENANVDDQPAEDIFSGKGLPAGFVNNIYVDPTDSDRVFAVFSNYGIPSIFMSEDAGGSWEDISGNLEQNADGSGNGPSVRWFAMNGDNDGYFAGTSTGLYFTYRLRGNRTRWFREPIRIGNGVVTQVKTRKDGFVAAGVHGNGVYSANFFVRPRPEPTLSVAYLLGDITVPINIDPFEIDITDLFVSSKDKPIDIELTNSNPGLVSAVIDGDKILVSISPETEGSAAIGLVATSGKEQVSEGFTINVIEPAIYQQVGPVASNTVSQFFTDFGGVVQSADDFVIPEGTNWKLRNITAFGTASGGPELTSATVVIFSDNGGVPGDVVYNSGAIEPISASTDTNLSLELPEEVTLGSGSYWLSVYANLAFLPNNTQWFWLTQSTVIGQENVIRDEGDLFGQGLVDWTPQSLAFGGNPEDLVFQIFGRIETAAEEETETPMENSLAREELRELATLEVSQASAVWPNPSLSEFYFSLSGADQKVNARVYNLLGQMIYEKSDLDTSQPFSWDASNRPAGIYFVKITGPKTDRSFKLVKR